jgi:meso-butanediol dehydrogenase/(S,S)-butanediol dehydrogenase/diacetyl reductase
VVSSSTDPLSESNDSHRPREGRHVAPSAIVTGSARGIGRAVAVRLARDGFAVTVLDLESAATDCEGVVEEIARAGGRARSGAVDVADSESVESAVDAHAAAWDGIDVMVANAGIAVTAPLLETTAAQWQQAMQVNVAGVFHCYRAAAARMVAQGRGGRLIGAASVAAHRGGAMQGAYSASKFAVRGLTQSVAQELAPHGITANVYSPGVVRTPMWDSIDDAMTMRSGAPAGSAMQAMIELIPLGRLETPDDVAGVVSFLASPDAAYITGQSLVVDGGIWFS